MKKYIFLLSVALIVFSCDNSDEITEIEEDINQDISDVVDLPSTFFNYANPDLPNHFTNGEVRGIDNTPNDNPVTDEGATLGRVLFYDKLLSANNTIACASCHLQENGFSDPDAFSTGFEGGLTGRNSMGLANARYYDNGRFFWDERASSLEEQVLMPIQDQVEMGLTLNELVSRIQEADYYQPLFQEAFGTTEVTTDRIASAMAQFVRSMVSFEARYDEGLIAANGNENADFGNFSELENLGKRLFFSARTQCSNCHETATFSGDAARNNGLDATLTDLGVGGDNGNNNDNGKFKVNSLRNIAVTGPFMHDGRFGTLREVVEFYNNGIQNSPNLDRRLRGNNGTPRRMNLNGQEIDALIAFLNTLTDNSFLSDDKFSNPFVNQ
ncbi:cytochrome-c peroxidase [Roseivirga misakiensis]|uniref:Cytochrome-c peroxidase n=1 Tax=Roseivirga misakiensis TaxID=1563681 RepID=A0A1E5T2Y9_9BACT|nr:cytochrome c peroxidase [Roseivirga misakiensis]OEK05753.1 cytochrome-c peroxidase [Roseivirga misakiensis]